MRMTSESAKVNVSDHRYKVEHNKRYRPEIPRGGGGKKNMNMDVRLLSSLLCPIIIIHAKSQWL